MNCQEIKELSSDYLDQQLAPHQVLLFEEHLKDCSNCRLEVETLRTTVSLIGSLDEIKTSPDFLSQVHRKIEKRGGLSRLWTWIFEPPKLKVPLEVTALLLVSITAFYLYYRSPELSREIGIPAPLESLKVPQDELREKAVVKKALGKKARRRENIRMAESKAPAKLEAQLAKPRSLEAAKEGLADKAEIAPQPEIQEIVADDVALYERRVKVLLDEVGGKLLIEKGIPRSGLLLTVELPESRQAEFLAALKEEVSAKFGSARLKEGTVRGYKQVQEKDALGTETPQMRLAPAVKSRLRADEPVVTLQLRILPKK